MPPDMPTRLIIFDLDGTLVDSREMILAVHRHIFTEHALPVPSEEAVMGLVGLSHREAFTGLVGMDGPIDSLIAAYKTRAWAFREAGLYLETMFDGAAALIADLRLRTDCRLAIATGKGRRGTDLILKQQGWTDAFSSIQTSDDSPSKPDPTMILRALADTAVEPADAVMIGDSVFDMQMALAAGVTPIGVAWGHQPATRLHAAGAAIIAEHFTDLARLLR